MHSFVSILYMSVPCAEFHEEFVIYLHSHYLRILELWCTDKEHHWGER